MTTTTTTTATTKNEEEWWTQTSEWMNVRMNWERGTATANKIRILWLLWILWCVDYFGLNTLFWDIIIDRIHHHSYLFMLLSSVRACVCVPTFSIKWILLVFFWLGVIIHANTQRRIFGCLHTNRNSINYIEIRTRFGDFYTESNTECGVAENACGRTGL